MRQGPSTTLLLALVVAGTTVCSLPPAAIAQATRPIPRDEGKNTVGEISEEVARVRFEKLGYSNIQKLTRKGDYWEATATKGGKPWQISLHARTGAKEEKPMTPQPK
jgi:hypothetical protein